MKNIFFKLSMLAFTAMFLLLSSCAKKNNSSSTRGGVAGRGDFLLPDQTQSLLGVNQCNDGSSTWGRLVNGTTSFGTAFRSSYADFLSAVISPDNLGELDGSSTSITTGVNFELKMKIVNNKLNLSESSMRIEINDSFVGTRGADGEIIKSINIPYSEAISGDITNVINGTGQFQLAFKDEYGHVLVTGNINGSIVTGEVTFSNSVQYDNSTNKSGSLGTFSLKTCGVVF